MLAHGDDKPIIMSELGWSSTGGAANSCTRGDFAGKKPDGVTEAQQAQYLTQAYQCLANDPYVKQADWFQADDETGNALNEFNHYGLYRTTAPASRRWRRSARWWPRVAVRPGRAGTSPARRSTSSAPRPTSSSWTSSTCARPRRTRGWASGASRSSRTAPRRRSATSPAMH